MLACLLASLPPSVPSLLYHSILSEQSFPAHSHTHRRPPTLPPPAPTRAPVVALLAAVLDVDVVVILVGLAVEMEAEEEAGIGRGTVPLANPAECVECIGDDAEGVLVDEAFSAPVRVAVPDVEEDGCPRTPAAAPPPAPRVFSVEVPVSVDVDVPSPAAPRAWAPRNWAPPRFAPLVAPVYAAEASEPYPPPPPPPPPPPAVKPIPPTVLAAEEP